MFNGAYYPKMAKYASTKVRPYVYFGHNPMTGEFYIGDREANTKPSHIDLFEYRTSSKIVEPIFDQMDWQVIAEFETGNDAFDFEQLSIYENWNNPLLLNKNVRLPNGRKRFKNDQSWSKGLTKETSAGLVRTAIKMQGNTNGSGGKGLRRSEKTKEKMRKPKTKLHCDNISKSKKGKINKPESYERASNTRRNRTEEQKKKQFLNLSSIRIGIATVYDLELKLVVKISKSEFNKFRNVRYVGLNSKLSVK